MSVASKGAADPGALPSWMREILKSFYDTLVTERELRDVVNVERWMQDVRVEYEEWRKWWQKSRPTAEEETQEEREHGLAVIGLESLAERLMLAEGKDIRSRVSQDRAASLVRDVDGLKDVDAEDLEVYRRCEIDLDRTHRCWPRRRGSRATRSSGDGVEPATRSRSEFRKPDTVPRYFKPNSNSHSDGTTPTGVGRNDQEVRTDELDTHFDGAWRKLEKPIDPNFDAQEGHDEQGSSRGYAAPARAGRARDAWLSRVREAGVLCRHPARSRLVGKSGSATWGCTVPARRLASRTVGPSSFSTNTAGPPIRTSATRLLERYYPMVRHVSASLLRRFPRCVDIEELSSAGIHGLYRALEAYDPERGGTFKTYCTSRIKGAILDELRSQDWVPRAVRVRAQRLDRAREELIGEFGREPTNYELAEFLGMTLPEVQEENRIAVTHSMKNFTDGEIDREDGDSTEPFSTIAQDDESKPSRRMEREELFTKMLDGLSEKERLILRLYYREELKMREIGERLQITESRVCQIHSNMMERLRKRLHHRIDEL